VARSSQCRPHSIFMARETATYDAATQGFRGQLRLLGPVWRRATSHSPSLCRTPEFWEVF